MQPDFSYEKQYWGDGFDTVIGVDEVGRGAVAGPVVAGAVVLPQDDAILQWGINDSKKLSSKRREALSVQIKQHAIVWAVGEVCNSCIDRDGIVHAVQRAMRVAVSRIQYQVSNMKSKCKIPTRNHYAQSVAGRSDTKHYLLTDAFPIKHVRGIGLKRQKAITKGDQKSLSIAAASIIAKVYRDDLMVKHSSNHPHYNWEQNKGYGTAAHKSAIAQHGLCPLHRRTFIAIQ